MDRRDVLVGGVGVSLAAAVLASGAAGAVAVGSKSELITRKIPSSGEVIPVLGLGTSGPFEVGASAAERAPLLEVLNTFFAAGARVIDTSPMYSTAEAVLGDLLTPAMHQRVFMATKVWTQGERSGVEQMSRSANLLKHDKLDLIQVHNLMDLDTHLKTLRQWKEEGKVKYVGVTHFTVASHDELAKIIRTHKLDFIQVNYSAFTRAAEKTLLPLAIDRGVAVLVNRPFEDGKVFARVRGKPVPAYAASMGCETWSQIFLKYIISNPAVTCVIPATGKVKHIQDNLNAARGSLPDAAQRKKILETIAKL